MTERSRCGYSIVPKLSVRDAAQAVGFYAAAFRAVELFRTESAAGAVVARLSINGAEFWISDESPQHENFSPLTLGGATTRMILVVPDPDSTFAAAVMAGAREVIAVHEAYDWRFGRVADPFGHHWEICHPLS